MQAGQYSKLEKLLESIQERAEDLGVEMRVLNRHETFAEPAVISKEMGAIQTELGRALDLLREIGRDKLKNMPTKEE